MCARIFLRNLWLVRAGTGVPLQTLWPRMNSQTPPNRALGQVFAFTLFLLLSWIPSVLYSIPLIFLLEGRETFFNKLPPQRKKKQKKVGVKARV